MSGFAARIRQGPLDIGAPGPSTREMMTGFRSIRADPLRFLCRARERYGDLVAFPVPGPPALLVSDPADVRRVLQTGARNWSKDTVQYRALARVTGPGLLASAEPNWLEHRRMVAPAFHHQRLHSLAARVADAGDRALDVHIGWSPRRHTVDVAEVCLRIALDVVGDAILSTDLSEQAHRLLEATSAAARLVVRLGQSILPERIPSALNRRLTTTRRKLDVLCFELIEARRACTSHGDDLLGLLIEGGLSDQEIRDELVTMVIAGHETVAAALSWTLMLLAEHQAAQDGVRSEVALLPGAVPMMQTRRVLPWTRAVIDEALRLYPPAWVISRRSRAADLIGGREVPAGTTAIISPWVLHRRADAWDGPEEFRPQRFRDDPTPRTHYLPFGAGPRLCIGRDFALGEMAIILSRIVSRFRVELPAEWSRPSPQADVAVHPSGGMPLCLTPIGSPLP
ncbi:cytochrome P450 [Flexivirga lutea]